MNTADTETDLTKVVPPPDSELSPADRLTVFEHLFRHLAEHRNTLELYAQAEWGLSALPEAQRDLVRTNFIKAIDDWAREVIKHAWVACQEPGGGKCPELDPLADTSTVDLPPFPPNSEAVTKLLTSLLLFDLTSTRRYSSHTRAFLSSFSPLPIDEPSIAQTLKHPESALESAQRHADAAKADQAQRGKLLRQVGMGLGAVAGGVLVGVTGGLAAPLVGAGVSGLLGFLGVGGTAAGMLATALASSSVVCGALFGAYGAKSTAEMVGRHTREVRGLALVPVNSPHKETLAVRLCVSGWLTCKEDVTAPWTIFDGEDTFALQWEVEALEQLSAALYTLIKAQAMKYVKAEIIKRTVLSALMSALSPMAWLSIGRIIDNPWMNAKALAVKTGTVLGVLLSQRVFGARPVSLTGYSLGSLVIFEALKYLSTLPPSDTAHLIEDVHLFGLPAPSDPQTWTAVRRVVAGRLVNGYQEQDYVLAVLSRASDASWGVAGLEGVMVKGVENVRCEGVEGHLQWRGMVGRCLEECGARGVVREQVQVQVEEVKSEIQKRMSEGEKVQDEVQVQKGVAMDGHEAS